MTKKVEVSIILPTYNEADNIGELVSRIKVSCREISFEILIVDDNSPDGTSTISEKLAVDYNFIRVINRSNLRGLTSAIQTGIDLSEGDIVVWMDADMSMPPELIPELIQSIENGYDIAVGSRFVKGGGFEVARKNGEQMSVLHIFHIYQNVKKTNDSFVLQMLSFLLNYFIWVMLDKSFKDYTSGFIAIKKSILKDIRLSGDYGEYFIVLIYMCIKMRYKIIEVPYISMPRVAGESKTGSNLFDYLRRGYKYVVTTIRLRLFS